MPIVLSARILAPVSALAAALLLGGCGSMTTYGTGTTVAEQTFQDVTGILSLSSPKGEPVDYRPRAPIVAPPTPGVLPPPGSGEATALAANWPNDPDAAAADKELVDEFGNPRDARFSLPEGANRRPVIEREPDSAVERLRRERMSNPEQAKKLFAEAKMSKTASVDAQGNPVRRYLTEPPVDYRAPDPSAPVEITEKPKKKKWDLWPFD